MKYILTVKFEFILLLLYSVNHGYQNNNENADLVEKQKAKYNLITLLSAY